MELSDLVKFNGHLLSPDDKTGMIYEIEGNKVVTHFPDNPDVTDVLKEPFS